MGAFCSSAERPDQRLVDQLLSAKVNHPNFRTGEFVPPPIQPYFARLSPSSSLEELRKFVFTYNMTGIGIVTNRKRTRADIYKDLARRYEKIKDTPFDAKYRGEIPIDVAFNSLRPTSPAADLWAFADQHNLKVYRGHRGETGLMLSYLIYDDLISAVYTSPEHLARGPFRVESTVVTVFSTYVHVSSPLPVRVGAGSDWS